MGKLLIIISVMVLLFLGIGTAKAPGDMLFWMSSGAVLYQQVRAVLGVLLLILLFTNPPRHHIFRVLTGMIALAIGTWTIQATYTYTMPLLDTLTFLSGSIALMVAALERRFSIDPSEELTDLKMKESV